MELLIILILILINGVFSMSEIALVSARKTRLEADAKRGDNNAKAALKTANAPNKFFSTVQIGITLIGILTGIFSGKGMTSDVETFVTGIALLQPYAHPIAVTTVVIIITFFSLVLGELLPKRIGLTNPEAISKIVARPMRLLTKMTAPFVWLLTFTTDLLIKLFNIKPSSENKVTEEEIKAIIKEGTEGGEVQEIEQDIVERVFNLGDRKVTSLMTHKNDIAFLEINQDAESTRQSVNKELHSVYPVYEKNTDNIKGVVILKDLFAHINKEGFKLTDYLNPGNFITEHTNVYHALQQFKESKVHYGIVMDEFGQMQGVITMNDVLEALVGGVSEFRTDEYTLEEREDGSWLIDGAYSFHDFLQSFDLYDLASQYHFNTISGLVLHQMKHIPKEGDKIKWLTYELEVIDMDGARIDKILMREIKD
ncbi:MAG: HlyC/CorC family transporter [Bacteroidia bacterium]|nr:HlyC/CorC family transporter [Bacteroidia bacterium]